jgi:hypothetical protein
MKKKSISKRMRKKDAYVRYEGGAALESSVSSVSKVINDPVSKLTKLLGRGEFMPDVPTAVVRAAADLVSLISS